MNWSLSCDYIVDTLQNDVILLLKKKILTFSLKQLNDYFEFPLELDLDIEGGKYLLPEAGRGDKNLYTLHR